MWTGNEFIPQDASPHVFMDTVGQSVLRFATWVLPPITNISCLVRRIEMQHQGILYYIALQHGILHNAAKHQHILHNTTQH